MAFEDWKPLEEALMSREYRKLDDYSIHRKLKFGVRKFIRETLKPYFWSLDHPYNYQQRI